MVYLYSSSTSVLSLESTFKHGVLIGPQLNNHFRKQNERNSILWLLQASNGENKILVIFSSYFQRFDI